MLGHILSFSTVGGPESGRGILPLKIKVKHGIKYVGQEG
jgi:hypothetical protein